MGNMKPIYVLYDGNCGLCRRTIASLQKFDLQRRLVPVNACKRSELEKHGLGGHFKDPETLRDMHAVLGEKIWKGFEAYRAIAGRLPLLWPVWPFLWIWPISWYGRRVYRHVADARSCEIT